MRRGVRFAAGVFLIASGMQVVAHWHFYVDDRARGPAAQELVRAMQGYVVAPAFGTTMWTVLCMFSLMFAVLLLLAGTAYWWMGKELPAARLRPLATASAWLCLVSTAIVAVAHPVLHAVLILLAAGLAFSYASWAGRVS
jgi:hypothetical protein